MGTLMDKTTILWVKFVTLRFLFQYRIKGYNSQVLYRINWYLSPHFCDFGIIWIHLGKYFFFVLGTE